MTCRRCSECAGLDHHWVENPDFGNDPELSDGPTDAEFLCEHCDAVGAECGGCGGTGGVDWLPEDAYDDLEYDDSDPEDCEYCKGLGIVLAPAKGPRSGVR